MTYSSSVVTRVLKKSIMGNLTDKTIEYYTNAKITSPLEEKFIIDYKIRNTEYTLYCNSETYEEALDYIKNSNTFKKSEILAAFSGDGKNITDAVVRASDPSGNFYKNTNFEVRASDISDFPIIIITKGLEIYRFEEEEIIEILPKT